MSETDDGSKPDLSKFRQRLAEHRAEEAAANPPAPVWDADLVPQMESTGISDAAQKVNDACDSIDIFEIYDRLVGKYRQEPGSRTESVKALCPAHEDTKPTSWFGIKDGKWLLTCGHTWEGWDKYKLAGLMWGLDDSGPEFWTIRCRLAREFRNVDYEELRAEAVPMPPLPEAAAGTVRGVVAAEDDPWEKAVLKATSDRLLYLEANDRARRIRAAGLFEPFNILNLQEQMALPKPKVTWTIEGLHALGGNTIIVASKKVGKTALMMNLVRHLADGDPFLGDHEVRPIEGRIAYLNYEVLDWQFLDRVQSAGVRNESKIVPLHLRERPLDLMDDYTFEWLKGELKSRDVEVLIVDPFSGAYFGDENSNSEMAAFVKRLDQFKGEAGIRDMFMPVHTGKNPEDESARGAAKLEDWADSIWRYVKNADGCRYLGGFARGVGDLVERETRIDTATEQITYSVFSGTRKEKASHSIKGEVFVYIAANPGCSTRDIRDNVMGKSEQISSALKQAIRDGDIETRPGARGRVSHYMQGEAPITTDDS